MLNLGFEGLQVTFEALTNLLPTHIIKIQTIILAGSTQRYQLGFTPLIKNAYIKNVQIN